MPRGRKSTSNGSVAALIAEATAQAAAALRERRAEVQAQLDEIDAALERIGGGNGAVIRRGRPPKAAAAATSGKKERVRRSPEKLAADAKKLAGYLEKHPGAKAKDIRQVADFGLDLRAFMLKHAGEKISTSGKKAGTTYFIGK